MAMFLIGQNEAVCCDPGGRFHGWLFKRHADGQFVSVRKLQEANPYPITHQLAALVTTHAETNASKGGQSE